MANTKEYNIKINGIQQSVDGVSSLGKEMGKTTNNIRETNKQIKALQSEMIGLDKSSARWKELSKQAGDLKDRVDDVREATRRWASDTKGLDDVINVAQSATAAFTLAKGAMSAFGMETEGAVEAIQKLQGAMAIIQSLQTLQNTLKGSSATAAIYNKTLGLLTNSMKGASMGAKALRVALASIGIGIIIGLVSLLVEHWEDLVAWFQKTVPWANKIGAVFKGIGQAILNWCVNPIKTLANVMKKVFSGDFSGALEEAKKGLMNQFKGTVDAYKKGYSDEVLKIDNERRNKQRKAQLEDNEYQLKMMQAKLGNEAKYSKEGIALQKKIFKDRKALAKGNADELKQIALDEANFNRECSEKKAAASKKSAAESKKAAKEAANAAKQAAKEAAEAAKKAAEEIKKLNEELHKERVKTNELNHESNLLDLDETKRKLELAIKEEVNLEKRKGLYEDLKALEIERIKLQQSFDEAKIFDEVNEKLGGVFASLQDFKNEMNGVTDKVTSFTQVQLTYFTNASLEIENIAKKTNNEIGKIQDDTEQKIEETNKNITKQGLETIERDIKNIMSLTKTNLDEKHFPNAFERLFSPKKSKEALEEYKNYWKNILDQAKANLPLLEQQWDAHLANIAIEYGQDSEEYRKALEEKKQAFQEYLEFTKKAEKGSEGKEIPKESSGGNQFIDSERFSGASKFITDAYEAYAAPIVEGLGDSIHMMLEFAIEEAQEALDEASELHDKAVAKVEESKSRIEDLQSQLATASAADAERIKSQYADELLLMNQREQEEKRLQKEKEKREQELQKQQKKQRKLELQQQLAEAIVSGALAVVNGLATKPFVPVGIAMGALAGVATAIQIATITKQISKLADGGLLQGRSHAQGGIAVGNTGIEVEGGEYVVNKRSTAKYLPLLQALNEEGARKKTVANQMGKMANGGQINYERVSSNLNSVDVNKVIQSSIGSIDLHPQVSVVDINRGQKNLAQVRQMAGATK